MNRQPGSLPYFDRLLQRLAADDPNALAAFGRDVHWGDWSDPARAGIAVADYGRAAEAMCLEVLAASHIDDGQKIFDVGCGFGGTIACPNERYGQLQLTGLNIDQQQLQRAAAQIEPRAGNAVQLVVADAAQLPLADASVDRAYERLFKRYRDKSLAKVELLATGSRGANLRLRAPWEPPG